MTKKPKRSAAQKAGRLLARRIYGEQELADRLYRAGYEEEEISQTLSFFKEQGYVDDQAFCAAYIRDKADFLRKGPRLIEMELGKRKVDREIVAQALVDHYPLEKQVDNALSLLEKWSQHKKDYSQEKLLYKLGQKGYSYGVAKEACNLHSDE